MRAVRLSELVEQGRLAKLVGLPTVIAASSPLRAEQVAVVSSPVSAPPPPRLQVGKDVHHKIELLAIQLLSISKSNISDPRALMREALISIDECIVSISSRH